MKVLHAQYARDETRRDRFFRGAKKMSELRHPAVVSVASPRGEDAGWHFFVMEYLARGDLARAVLERQLTQEDALRVVLTAAEGLQAAHEAGMIHRDVCPANILMRDDGSGVVSDFDLVRASDTIGGTRTSAMGRWVYAAPETMQAAAGVDQTADVYSIGMSSLFALLGHDVPADIIRDQRRVLASTSCSAPVRRVIERAIDWDRRKRFPTVREFREAMGTALSVPARRDREGSLGGREILIVDDEKFIRDIVADFVGMEGATAHTAASLAEARSILKSRDIDVVVLDLKVEPTEPVAASVRLLRELRGLPSSPACIVVSGLATIENVIDVMKTGANDFLIKPFKVEEVVACLVAACRGR